MVMATLVFIGCIIAIIKLIYYIYNNKPRLKLESVYFRKDYKEKNDFIPIKISLRNRTKNPTTIERIWITTGNLSQMPDSLKMIKIRGHSSKELNHILKFKKGELKNYFNGDYIKFRIIIVHTFGVITREGKTSFKTGYFTLK